MTDYKATAELEKAVNEIFPKAKLINSTEWPNWKDIARTYKGVKIIFVRKWMKGES